MSNYTLSVVIPTYNTQDYLERCVESLFDPRIDGKVQIIIVNDGSKDGSLAVAQKLAQEKDFVLVIDKPNGGHGSTINKGVEVASGKYFRVLDSDDWYETETFVKFIEQLENIDSDVVITWGYYDRVYEKKQLPYVMFDDDSFIEYGKEYKFDEFDFHNKYLVMAHISYRTEVLKKNYRPLLENTFYVDNEFLLYPMVNVKTLIFLDMKIYHYFFGRPEQSMNKDVLKRNISHIERVSFSIAEFLDCQKNNSEKTDYLISVASKVARTYYIYLLAYFPFNRIWAYKMLKKFDRAYKQQSIEAYNELHKTPYIRIYRKFPCLFTAVSPEGYAIKSWFDKK